MIWQELSIQVPGEFVEPVSYLFGRYGHGLSAEDLGDGQVLMRSYLPNTSRRRLARIEVGISLVRKLQPMSELQVTDLKDSDWETAWKAHFGILKIGRRLVISRPGCATNLRETRWSSSLTRAWPSAPATTPRPVRAWRPWRST